MEKSNKTATAQRTRAERNKNQVDVLFKGIQSAAEMHKNLKYFPPRLLRSICLLLSCFFGLALIMFILRRMVLVFNSIRGISSLRLSVVSSTIPFRAPSSDGLVHWSFLLSIRSHGGKKSA